MSEFAKFESARSAQRTSGAGLVDGDKLDRIHATADAENSGGRKSGSPVVHQRGTVGIIIEHSFVRPSQREYLPYAKLPRIDIASILTISSSLG